MSKVILVTGGAGFIGSALIKYLIKLTSHFVINLDKLTYASDLGSLKEISASEKYRFIQGDICDTVILEDIFTKYNPDYVINLAAESHVDRSIVGAGVFMQTNIIGTYTLLEVSRIYYSKLKGQKKQGFRFYHISTDEVYGDLPYGRGFTENANYEPSSPYSASKASADHLVRSWHRTYGLPVLISCCSNNYGPFQHHEKLIPNTILNALAGKPIPVYGNGLQVRDWLYVEDHIAAIYAILCDGKIGDTYNIGGNSERRNIDVVNLICEILDEITERNLNHSKRVRGNNGYKSFISYVEDRPGHDVRYAINASKLQSDLGWKALETFESGLRKTVLWYVNEI